MPLKPTKPNASAKGQVSDEKEKVVAANVASAPVEATAPAAEGKTFGQLAEHISFVACLGDPSVPDVNYIDTGKVDANGKKIQDKKVYSTIVGYRFVADVDLDVPDVKPGDDFKKNPMSCSGDLFATKHVPAGQTFDLTRFETGMLLSREEFNARTAGKQGSGIATNVVYTTTKKVSQSGAQPGGQIMQTVSLKATEQGKSVRDVPCIDILTFETHLDPKLNVNRKTRQIIPGFEKWEVLARNNTVANGFGGRSSGAMTKDDTNTRNTSAANFLAMAARKAGK